MGRGRPKSNNPRIFTYRLRLTKDEFENLKTVSEQLQMPKSVLVRDAINKYLKGEINTDSDSVSKGDLK